MVVNAINFPDVSPHLFSFNFGGIELALRWYSLSYILGIIIALIMMKYLLRKPSIWYQNNPPMSIGQADDLITFIIIGIIIGGRLGFVFFYQLSYFLSNPVEVVMVWKGGMSFHGGLLGVIFATILFCKRNFLSIYNIGDLLAVCTPPGLFLGRIANFINNELWGKPTDFYFGVIFPGPLAQNCPGFSSPCSRHPSQLYEAGLEGALLGFLMLWLVFNRFWFKKPGNLLGFFLFFYGISRFTVEIVRQPDIYFISTQNPLGYLFNSSFLNITMGQTLSIPMIVFGLLMLVRPRHYD
jgi:phosphatidylglycerol:prolipoprotein diacylglycerol transferase